MEPSSSQDHDPVYDQNLVTGDYNAIAYQFGGKRGSEYLHMVFSPNSVPIGLTDEQVRICIILGEMRQSLDKDKLSRWHLVPEFSEPGPMTMSRFKRGVYKYIKSISEL